MKYCQDLEGCQRKYSPNFLSKHSVLTYLLRLRVLENDWKFDFYRKTINVNLDKGSVYPANTLGKSNVILWLYFGNLRKLLSANANGT